MSAQTTSAVNLEAAFAAHRRGELGVALAGYAAILENDPDDVNALHLSGTIALSRGDRELARACVGRAVELQPQNVAFRYNFGQVALADGDVATAIVAFRIVVDADPAYADAWNALALALSAARAFDAARVAAQRGVEADPAFIPAAITLAVVSEELRDFEAAITTLEDAFRRAPDNVVVLRNLAALYQRRGRFDRALDLARSLLAIDPDQADGHVLLGNALVNFADFDAARAAYVAALERDPRCAPATYGLAIVSRAKLRYAESLAFAQSAVAQDSELADARFYLASLNLLLGNFAAGFRDYHWVTRMRNRSAHYIYHNRAPVWDGSPLTGRSLLLTDEQGYGDIIQVARFLPALADFGGEVVVEVRSALAALIQRSFPACRTVAYTGQPIEFDRTYVHLPMMQLPSVLGLRDESAFARKPRYLEPDPVKVARMREVLRIDGRFINVGLVWRGNPEHENDADRSTTLEAWAPLADVTGVRYFSLLHQATASELATARFPIEPANEWIADFDDTAAIVENLDLVIGVDTAPIHLAGALAKPVFLANRERTDWRWMLGRADSPWYPTLRIFRQPNHGDWPAVFTAIARALEAFVASGRTTTKI